jgi:hypothetical protein
MAAELLDENSNGWNALSLPIKQLVLFDEQQLGVMPFKQHSSQHVTRTALSCDSS